MLRIGELSRRSGVSPELLRAWERRYGLVRPVRSTGGLRLYAPEDLERVRRMKSHLEAGVAAAEAASLALDGDSGGAALDVAAAAKELAEALDRFDEASAHAVIDRLLAAATLDTVLAGVVLPYLRELGDRWKRGDASVAQEHFASTVLRGRLLGLARGWGRGVGPLALLACLPGEQHEFGLLAFGLLLRERGWRIAYLGADTPFTTVEETAAALQPQLVVLAAVAADAVSAVADDLRALARTHRVAVGGQGAGAANAGVEVLDGDLVAAADRASERGTLRALPS